MDSRMSAAGIMVLLIVISNVLSAGCFEEGRSNKGIAFDRKDDSQATDEGVASLVTANNRFAFELIHLLNETRVGENMFLSPYSIMVCMAMLYEGARGQTAEEMLSVFHYPEDDITRRSSFARLHNLINQDRDDYELSTANALWLQEGCPFLSDYLNITEQYYAGKVSNVDFVAETEATRQMINEWVEDQTKGKIVELLKPDQIHPLTLSVLTNAIYFKADWLYKFDKEDTRERDFKVDSNKTVSVPMMNMDGKEFYYTSKHGFDALELPYRGNEISMLVLLPSNENVDPLDLSIDEVKLSEIRDSLKKGTIDIYLPKFEFDSRYDLEPPLVELGMPTAFAGGADFSGMDGGGSWLDFVVHQAYVKVDEEGTEAAAATAASTSWGSPPSYIADHPFLIVIQQKDNGNILFIGKVADPSVSPEE
jgi:serpin B